MSTFHKHTHSISHYLNEDLKDHCCCSRLVYEGLLGSMSSGKSSKYSHPGYKFLYVTFRKFGMDVSIYTSEKEVEEWRQLLKENEPKEIKDWYIAKQSDKYDAFMFQILMRSMSLEMFLKIVENIQGESGKEAECNLQYKLRGLLGFNYDQ